MSETIIQPVIKRVIKSVIVSDQEVVYALFKPLNDDRLITDDTLVFYVRAS